MSTTTVDELGNEINGTVRIISMEMVDSAGERVAVYLNPDLTEEQIAQALGNDINNFLEDARNYVQ